MKQQIQDYNLHIAVLNKHQAVNHIDALTGELLKYPRVILY